MSYQQKKIKRSKWSRFKFKIGIAYNWFKSSFGSLRKEKTMFLPQTRKVMKFLRTRNYLIRSNNQKINQWVDGYVDRCVREGKPVVILSQWCISKDLEERYRQQEGRFIPTKKERRIFKEEIPQILSLFRDNGQRVSWWITYNRSYLDSGRIDQGTETAYKKMVGKLAKPLVNSGSVILLDWEEDILGRRPRPSQDTLESIDKLVSPGAFRLELERHSRWAREEAGLNQGERELEEDVRFQIACEVEEGKLLCGENSPFGEFILVPLEVPERYDFFVIFSREFKDRITSVLTTYPWRF